jgi:hypothetical protein
VSIWRQLQRLGAATLTPGAALLPWEDELVEQLDWLAQEVDEGGGSAWVLRIHELAEVDQRRVIEHANRERAAEYAAIRDNADRFIAGSLHDSAADDGYSRRLQSERELSALKRRFRKVRDRDHFDAPGRLDAAAAIDRCLRNRQEGRNKLSPSLSSVGRAR